jgi:hypothetical protein
MWPVPPKHNLKLVIVSGFLALVGLIGTHSMDVMSKLGAMGVVIILMSLAVRSNMKEKQRRESFEQDMAARRQRAAELDEEGEDEEKD